ncbi:MAG TPA: DEAD/DEAH box helicase family protein [Fimbriimonadaceae bacterium]|nr:DEAD/DEAH box helicase family protein [Fimbriimonadaceae bacterium]HRJ95533.1 DEAD/DEAH box helicase family protein [Fimbriimonadaceae bacterium]
MSNFAFLHPSWTPFLEDAREAERVALRNPRSSAFYSRRLLELGVKWVYANDSTTSEPYQDTLSARIHEPSFRNQLPVGLWEHVKYVWKLGNQATHEPRTIQKTESVEALRSVHNFINWLVTTYTPGGLAVPAFDDSLIPDPKKIKELRDLKVAENLQQIQMLEASLREKDEAKATAEAKQAATEAELAALRAEIQKIKAENAAKGQTITFSEAENRAHLIDPLLRESGWNPDAANVREYEVNGMPNPEGKGFVDYVLWGTDGKPVAVVEAKKTQVDPELGKHQAKLYADCLETMTGRRPLIYFTNGYRTWFWDDTKYPPRSVGGFHSQDELQLIIKRRQDSGDLLKAKLNKNTVDRQYQEVAIGRTSERFQTERGRGALLVMATGTGKTRVSVALVEMLMKQNWVRRTLFLADRRALLTQAERAFKRFLPETSRGSLLDGEVPDACRIVFSTYPTMMNAIDSWREDGTRRFGPGHFDLVIIDEAHRSVYQKYKAIFEYFDSLLLGLTATPKTEVDRNTYELFGLEPGVPTHAYELDEAVEQQWLVPPRAFSVPVKFLRQGIKYDELPEDEKQTYEQVLEFYDENGELIKDQDSAALNAWLFNKDTVDKVLQDLMQNGVKVSGGDKLGKTIIFAKSKKHADFIVQRFDQAYPHLAGHFCQTIYNQPYAQDLIDNFSVPANEPTIAVSVDMMDTGIDVPEVVNLVFFKMIRSKTKFWQMIGRGTRLCPDLFGPGLNKTHFLIFDYCQNLEYFSLNPRGVEGNVPRSVRENTMRARAELIRATSEIEDLQDFRKGIVNDLYGQVQALNKESFVVRPHEEVIEPYRVRTRWDELGESDLQTVESVIAPIPATELDDEGMRRFDLLMLRLELAILRKTKDQEDLVARLKDLAQNLSEKGSVPSVAAEMALLLEIGQDAFWQDITLPQLESTRIRLRGLVKFADTEQGRQRVFVNFEDAIGDGVEVILTTSDPSLNQYREKLRHYLRDHLTHPAVRKVRENVPLSKDDVKAIEAMLFGDQVVEPTKLEAVIGTEGPLSRFVRKTVGLDKEAAKRAFSDIFDGVHMSAKQLLFMNHLVDFLCTNGVMNPGSLFEPPFTHLHDMGIDGIFPEQAASIVKIIEQINANAAVPN